MLIETIQDDPQTSSTVGARLLKYQDPGSEISPAEPKRGPFLAGHSLFLLPLWPRLPASPGGFMHGTSSRRMMLRSTATSMLFPAASAPVRYLNPQVENNHTCSRNPSSELDPNDYQAALEHAESDLNNKGRRGSLGWDQRADHQRERLQPTPSSRGGSR